MLPAAIRQYVCHTMTDTTYSHPTSPIFYAAIPSIIVGGVTEHIQSFNNDGITVTSWWAQSSEALLGS